MSIKARKLRKDSTPEEIILWQRLRARRFNGLKFKRQHPFGPYVADFVCLDHKLVVEVDGSQHLEQISYDQQRTEYIQHFGFRVMRFWNNDVRFQLETVLEKIWSTIEN